MPTTNLISVNGNDIVTMNTLVLGEQEKALIDEACRLAGTGRYADYTDIEHVLRFGYGLSDARALLDRQPVRMMINRRCADARDRLQVAAIT
jgi:hypothetical protein